MNETIAAISTPLGEGAIGIVRMTGKEAIEIARKVFISKKNKNWFKAGSHRVFYGWFVDPTNGEVIDEVLATVMIGPHTFTREDVVEFSCHGGIVPMRRILSTLLNHGASIAGPGEFSKRAFLNGRLDLAQAESIIDIIRAKNDQGLRLAINQLEGSLSVRAASVQDSLVGVMAGIEVNIDFPGEDVDGPSYQELVMQLDDIIEEVEGMLTGAEKGKVYREGVATIIVGKPNVGKSSLLNALLKENRAIVTEIPGTTRDVIEETVNIKGISLRLMDTAGLRETEDVVEKMGVARTREFLADADLVLTVLDAVSGVEHEDMEILKLVKANQGLVLINKVDAAPSGPMHKIIAGSVGDQQILDVSVTEGRGLDRLEEKIEEVVVGGKIVVDHLVCSNIRHINALKQAHEYLESARDGIKLGVSSELVAVDVREAWERVGEITGLTVSEDIVDKIFANFCIGK